ncbi:MAG: M23 family metallopeptidase [Litorivicinaceae bacterium]
MQRFPLVKASSAGLMCLVLFFPESADAQQHKGGAFQLKRDGIGCPECQALDGYLPPNEIPLVLYQMVGKIRKGDKDEDVRIQKVRGATPTGTYPKFVNDGNCPEIDSEKWAIDYSHKRSGAAIHKGIDIPQPEGTPVLAAASGTVVGKFLNQNNRKGIEVVLRHTPAQTGLSFYTYTQYTHLLEMSPLPIGASVLMGDEIAKISNTGKMGNKIRRDALHFAVMYSESPGWTNDGTIVVPQASYWMDPVFFYSTAGPYDSVSVERRSNKAILTPYITRTGTVVPAETNRIWPFACQ